MLKPSHYRFSVPPEYTGQRLDQVIPACCENLSRTYVRKLIDIGGVHVQQRRVHKCALEVSSGVGIEVFIDGRALDLYRIKPEEIIYQDKYILVLNKPSGVVMQPTPARYKGSMYEAALCHLQNPFQRHSKPELGMVQRLDCETSGVIVFSIHKSSHKALTACFTQRTARKGYLALVAGELEEKEGRIQSLLARNRASNKMKSVAKGGKEAITDYRVLEQVPGYALLEVDILTGRTHQIRVHLSEAGYPIVGDLFYGGSPQVNSLRVGRSLLHAHSLGFPHLHMPEKQLQFAAPLPADFVATLIHAGFTDAFISQYRSNSV
ncbi:MAG: RluA family pseudouridine synthase [Desulfuromonadaceae bacterium]|nr:RluA family pseudouridine synthase [Desulfuromonas sp.]MDY0186117.1 RluA family pseudouridine synthase [Desulfuromonadaceae bacterium]